MNKLIASSANPNRLSLTVGGLIVGLIPFMIHLAETQGIILTSNEIISFIDRASFVLAEVAIFIGMLRKFYYWVQSKRVDK